VPQADMTPEAGAMADLNAMIEEIAARRRDGDLAGALRLCDEILASDPAAYNIRVERAYVHKAAGDLEKAVDDMSTVIAQKPVEPCFFFDRAYVLIEAGNHEGAAQDLTEVLRLCDQWGNDYYREAAHFALAYAHLRMGQAETALDHCRNVRDDY